MDLHISYKILNVDYNIRLTINITQQLQLVYYFF